MLKTIHYSALISLALMTLLSAGCKAEEQGEPKRRFTILQNLPDKDMVSIPIYENLKNVFIWPTTDQTGNVFRRVWLKEISPGALVLNKMSTLTDAKIQIETNRSQPIYEWPETKDESTLLLWVNLDAGPVIYSPDNLGPYKFSVHSRDRSYSTLTLTVRHMRLGHATKYCALTLPHHLNDKDKMLKIIDGGISYCLENNATRRLVVLDQDSARSTYLD
jgi:hypothetical protein